MSEAPSRNIEQQGTFFAARRGSAGVIGGGGSILASVAGEDSAKPFDHNSALRLVPAKKFRAEADISEHASNFHLRARSVLVHKKVDSPHKVSRKDLQSNISSHPHASKLTVALDDKMTKSPSGLGVLRKLRLAAASTLTQDRHHLPTDAGILDQGIIVNPLSLRQERLSSKLT